MAVRNGSKRSAVLPSSMEPMLPVWKGSRLEDLALELAKESASLASSVSRVTQSALSRLVRSMNAYYSNLIEGQHTLPVDIDRALETEYLSSPEKRDLQILARAHIEVESELEAEVRNDTELRITAADYLRDIHRRFYARLPESFLWVYTRSGDRLPVIPGELRDHDVTVGEHLPPPSPSLPALLDRFADVYELHHHHGIERIICALCSHHRLAWIHPFLDGNGRVTRLFTQSMLIRAGLDSCGLWTISRGLARNREEYRLRLSNADAPRRSDYDGRGSLSEQALTEFTEFMLVTALDQVRYMRGLFGFEEVLGRIERYVEMMVSRGRLRPEARFVLEAAYLRGELPRGEANRLTGLEERMARKVTADLVKQGLLRSEHHRAPLRIELPSRVAPWLFPNLYPSDVESELLRIEQ